MDAASEKQSLVDRASALWNADRAEAWLADVLKPGRRPPFLLPLALLILATLLLRATDIDLAVSGLFYDPVSGQWPFLKAQPWDWLYHWGVLPGIALGVVGLTIYLLQFTVRPLREYRKASLFLALAVILGPGLVINGVMKPGWGRPRPCQVMQFGGNAKHLPPFEIGHYHRSASFPSGHASIGFALIAPMFLAYRRHKHLAALFFTLGTSAGLIMGVTRIVQGRHFLSDVIWSGATVYFTCWLLAAVMRLYAHPKVLTTRDDRPASEEPHVLRLSTQSSLPPQGDEADDRPRRAA